MADRIAILDQGRVVQLGTPRELYRRPGSRFVAEFLGETNFIEAEVATAPGSAAGAGSTGHADRELVLRCPAGTLRALVNGSPASLEPGTPVTCSIRPEAFRLANGEASEVLRATRRETMYLGEIAQHLLDLDGGPSVKVAELNPFGGGRHIAAGAAPHAPESGQGVHANGHPVNLTVSPEDVVVLGRE